jgi:hypothetical protein
MVWGIDFNLININQIDKTTECKRLNNIKRTTHTVPDKDNSAELKFYICNHQNYGYNTDYIQDYINIEGHNRKITHYINRFGGCNIDASVHYQGHVYFSKAIVFIHKENEIPGKNYYNQSYIEGVTTPADFYTENEEDKLIQIPFEKGYTYNGISKYIIKRIKIRNTKYPYKLSKYIINPTAESIIKYNWVETRKTPLNLLFDRPDNSILKIPKFHPTNYITLRYYQDKGIPQAITIGIGKPFTLQDILVVSKDPGIEINTEYNAACKSDISVDSELLRSDKRKLRSATILQRTPKKTPAEYCSEAAALSEDKKPKRFKKE